MLSKRERRLHKLTQTMVFQIFSAFFTAIVGNFIFPHLAHISCDILFLYSTQFSTAIIPGLNLSRKMCVSLFFTVSNDEDVVPPRVSSSCGPKRIISAGTFVIWVKHLQLRCLEERTKDVPAQRFPSQDTSRKNTRKQQHSNTCQLKRGVTLRSAAEDCVIPAALRFWFCHVAYFLGRSKLFHLLVHLSGTTAPCFFVDRFVHLNVFVLHNLPVSRLDATVEGLAECMPVLIHERKPPSTVCLPHSWCR